MVLRIVADSLDELPDGLRATAKQEGAAFVVADMPDGWAIEDVAGLKSSVVTARKERDDAKKLAKAFEGIDPEKAGDARDALEKLAAGTLRGSKEIDEYKASLEAKFANDRSKSEVEKAALLDQVKHLQTTGELSPIIAAKGGGDAIDAILTLAAAHIRYEQDDHGALKASLVSKDGSPLVTKKAGSADPMGFEEFVEQMREAPATRGLFRASATGGSGGGSQTGGSGRTAGNGNVDISTMSPAEMIALGDRRG